MIFVIEAIVLCVLFTLMVIVMAKDPIKTLYNYPPKIQKRVKSLGQYKDKIPAKKNKVAAKLTASVLFVIILSLILRYANGYTTFTEGFGYGFLLWTIVNAYDAIVLDICWLCHDPRFVFEGTEEKENILQSIVAGHGVNSNGKTTILHALAEYLSQDYLVISMDFQMQMSGAKFRNEHSFSLAFASCWMKCIRTECMLRLWYDMRILCYEQIGICYR